MRLSVLVFLLFSSFCSYSQQTIDHKGNKITLSGRDTITIYDPIDGSEHTKYEQGRPMKINGETIYDVSSTVDAPEYKHTGSKATKLTTLIFDSLKNELQQLEDGEYTLEINDPVIGKGGTLIYYRYGGVKKLRTDTMHTTNNMNSKGEYHTMHFVEKNTEDKSIPVGAKTTVNRQAQLLLEHIPTMSSGVKDGKPVNVTGSVFGAGTFVTVKAHKATLQNTNYFSL